jgi:hypothetical protein
VSHLNIFVREAVSEEHLMGPSMFVCLLLLSANCYDDLEHMVATMASVHNVAAMTLGHIIALVSSLVARGVE